MPLNKRQYERMLIIDYVLSDLKAYSFTYIFNKVNQKMQDNLMDEHFHVSERSIYNDLLELELIFGAPIVKIKDGRTVKYKYEEEFSIREDKNPELMKEINRLKLLLDKHLIEY